MTDGICSPIFFIAASAVLGNVHDPFLGLQHPPQHVAQTPCRPPQSTPGWPCPSVTYFLSVRISRLRSRF